MSEKIVFLDLHGVIFPFGKKKSKLDCIHNLNTILDETKAKIVLTSSSRFDYPLDYFYNYVFEGILRGEIIGLTPELDSIEKNIFRDVVFEKTPGKNYREEEIIKYIKLNSIEKFVILDDSFLCFEENYIRINGDRGIRERDVRKAITILGKG